MTLPLILLSGMGADARFLDAQTALANVRIADWIPAFPVETLPEYARRMAKAVDPGEPCLVGGVSMGGMVALEMSRHLDARACLLIASVRGSDQLPPRWRLFRSLIRAVPPSWFCGPPAVTAGLLTLAGRFLPSQARSLLDQFASTDGRFLHWAIWAVLNWKPTQPSVPVAHIHGDRDFMLPHRRTQPDVLVRGAGHLLPMTYPNEVNAFLRQQRERFERQASAQGS